MTTFSTFTRLISVSGVSIGLRPVSGLFKSRQQPSDTQPCVPPFRQNKKRSKTNLLRSISLRLQLRFKSYSVFKLWHGDPCIFWKVGISNCNPMAKRTQKGELTFYFAKITSAITRITVCVFSRTLASYFCYHLCSFRWISGNRLLSTDLSEATGKLFALPAVLFFARRKPLQPLHSVVGQT